MKLQIWQVPHVNYTITVDSSADNKEIEGAALNDENVSRAIGGKSVAKVIIVPGRLVNIVAK